MFLLQQHQQQFAEAGRKQVEQVVSQLQEQLQLNIIHQSQLAMTTLDKVRCFFF